MINLTLVVNEKVLLTIHPHNFAGATSEVKDATWTVLSGSSTVTPSADGMSAVIAAPSSVGTSLILVGANTNLSSSVNTGSVNTGSFSAGAAWDYTQHSKKSNKKHDKHASTFSAPTVSWWNDTNWSQHDKNAYAIHSSSASDRFTLDKMENTDGIIYNHITVNVVAKRVDKTHGQSTNLGLTAGSPEHGV